MIRAVLFDLDGTLLPLNQDEFVKTYMRSMAAKMAERGYAPERFVECMWQSVSLMVANDGSKTNEEVFNRCFSEFFGRDKLIEDTPFMDGYYKTDFWAVRAVCGCDARADKCVRLLAERGVLSVLATNPLFPSVATHSRARWAGLNPDDFALITTLENSHYSKPNPDYYREIFEKLGVLPKECIMVGNDVSEDMIAEELGCSVFLLTDNLLNKTGEDISKYKSGGFDALLAFLDEKTR